MRLSVQLLAAVCRAWLRSPTRAAVRALIRWRTAYLLEDVDEKARDLRDLRDLGIPRAFRELAVRKQELLAQWDRYADEDATCPAPRPDPDPRPAGGWSPHTPARVGPLFQQRNPKQ
jgi:hypothetical protein